MGSGAIQSKFCVAVLFSGYLCAMIFLYCFSFPAFQLIPSKTFIWRYFAFLLFIPPVPTQKDGRTHPEGEICVSTFPVAPLPSL